MQAFLKVRILVEISKISKNLEILKKSRGMRSCFTSYPSGNQVDGSPLVAIAKRARVEPRTQVHVTMEMLFQMGITNDYMSGNFRICFR